MELSRMCERVGERGLRVLLLKQRQQEDVRCVQAACGGVWTWRVLL